MQICRISVHGIWRAAKERSLSWFLLERTIKYPVGFFVFFHFFTRSSMLISLPFQPVKALNLSLLSQQELDHMWITQIENQLQIYIRSPFSKVYCIFFTFPSFYLLCSFVVVVFTIYNYPLNHCYLNSSFSENNIQLWHSLTCFSEISNIFCWSCSL